MKTFDFPRWRLALLTFIETLCSMACLASLMLAASAWAQPAEVAAPASTMQWWVQLLAWAGPLAVLVVLVIRPLVKLGNWFHAKAQDDQMSARQKAALLGAESIARSLDHYLEVGGDDIQALFDPAKRLAALQHLEASARSGAAPAAGDALNVMGAQWLTGTASAAIDLVLAKIMPPPVAPAVPAGGAA